MKDSQSNRQMPSVEPGEAREQLQPSLTQRVSDESTTYQQSFSRIHEIAFITLICMAQLLTQASLAQSVSIMQYISGTFNITDPGVTSWYAAAFSLTVGTFILPSGRFGDIYGHKNLFIFGWIWMGIFSIICGLAAYVPGSQGSIFFSAMKGLQGIGPAIVMPNGVAILGRTYPPGKKKNMIFSLFGANAPGGFILGATFSTLLAERSWWPWGYWIMGIVNIVIAFLVIFVVPTRPRTLPPRGFKEIYTSLDVTGILLSVAGLVLFNAAWNQGPVVGWQTPYTYVLLIIGLLLLVLFFLHESSTPHPLIPIHALGASTIFVLVCIAAGWSSFGIWIFYFWDFSLNLRNLAPLLVTAQMSPVAVSGATAAVCTGLILHKIGPARTMLLSMTGFFVGTVLLATMPISQNYWAQTFVAMIVTPWGMDMSFPAANILLSNAVKEHDQGIAASLVNTVLNYSISIGLGIAGTVCRQVNPQEQQDLLLKDYRSAWYTGMGLSGLGVIVAAAFVLHNELAQRKEQGEKKRQSDGRESQMEGKANADANTETKAGVNAEINTNTEACLFEINSGARTGGGIEDAGADVEKGPEKP